MSSRPEIQAARARLRRLVEAIGSRDERAIHHALTHGPAAGVISTDPLMRDISKTSSTNSSTTNGPEMKPLRLISDF